MRLTKVRIRAPERRGHIRPSGRLERLDRQGVLEVLDRLGVSSISRRREPEPDTCAAGNGGLARYIRFLEHPRERRLGRCPVLAQAHLQLGLGELELALVGLA